MRQMNDLRPNALADARGEVLEVGFGSGLNLDFYPAAVTGVVGIEPHPVVGLPALEARMRAARFPVEQHALRADGGLPFDSARFDCVVTTWTLCSIPDPVAALREMRRVLRPGGSYLFIEHGRAPTDGLARWQDRLNPAWRRLAGGCNMNRPIDAIVESAGFQGLSVERFRHAGPALLSHMYRGSARIE
jgi:SAM-dependent methyltransferase